jgi:hypothetical protein
MESILNPAGSIDSSKPSAVTTQSGNEATERTSLAEARIKWERSGGPQCAQALWDAVAANPWPENAPEVSGVVRSRPAKG